MSARQMGGSARLRAMTRFRSFAVASQRLANCDFIQLTKCGSLDA